jgi:PKD repeat protein
VAQDRPSLAAEQTYTTTHFIIHYTISGTDSVYAPTVDVDPANGVPDYVDWVAEDAETVWNTQITTFGWLEPPPDTGEGGDTRYDVYLKNTPPYYGYVEYVDGFVGDNPNSTGVTETNAYYSYLVVENDFAAYPGNRRDNIRVTLAHEFNHSIQIGYGEDEALWLMEATSTWMEDEVYDNINDNYQFLDELFLYPDIALDVPDGQAYFYGYSRWIFIRYISEHQGGQSTVRRAWEHSVISDNLDAVNGALVEVGTTFEALFPRFVAANYVLSSLPQNYPYTYEEANGYRNEVGGVETEAILPFTGTMVTYDSYYDGNEHYLEKHSTEYWVISATVSFEVTFQGNPGIDYAVQGALRQGNQVTVKQVPLTSQQGTLVVYNPTGYDEVVIIVANRGDTDETSSYDLAFQTTTETPPTASFSTTPLSGTVATEFEFDSSTSTDAQTPGNQLEVRWDWEGDAVWDTAWSVTKTASYIFSQAGVYTVALEVRDAADLRDVTTHAITVANTSPTATFGVTPTLGTVDTVFDFDASACSDSETPSAELEVRWDWEGDDIWDTVWSVTKTASYSYTQPGVYTASLEVRDAGDLRDEATRTITVANTSPTAAFVVLPIFGTVDTVFDFDASASSDSETPLAELEVRWDWEGDTVWDTTWTMTKTASHQYSQRGTYTATMEVRDAGDLRDVVTRTVIVGSMPPTATFSVTPTIGTVDTVFSFDASASSDDETPPAELEVRWDWESNGEWDTGWNTDKAITHTYTSAGTYTVTLSVRDSEHLESETTHTLEVIKFYAYMPLVMRTLTLTRPAESQGALSPLSTLLATRPAVNLQDVR